MQRTEEQKREQKRERDRQRRERQQRTQRKTRTEEEKRKRRERAEITRHRRQLIEAELAKQGVLPSMVGRKQRKRIRDEAGNFYCYGCDRFLPAAQMLPGMWTICRACNAKIHGVKYKQWCRTYSVAYQRAMHELRRQHPDEFRKILTGTFAEAAKDKLLGERVIPEHRRGVYGREITEVETLRKVRGKRAG